LRRTGPGKGETMIKEYTQTWGVSGLEKRVSDLIIKEVMDYADEVTRDAMGNLIVLKRGNGSGKKRVMCAAHMDEIGLCVVRILDNGLLKVKQVGGVSALCSFMNRVRFENGTIGTVGVTEPVENVKTKDMNKLYIDIGAMSKEEAEQYVQPGDCAVFCGDYVELAGRNVMSKAFDDRIACYIQTEALKRIQSSYHDLYFVYTVQEEVGLFGSTTSAETVKPDLGIAVDITGSFDVPGDEHGNPVLGKGAAIKINDSSVICDHELTEDLIACAKKYEIPYQRDALAAGGTDAGAINKSGEGVKVLGISIPTRYGHTPNSIVNLEDVEACIRLLECYLTGEIPIVTQEKIK